MLSGNSFEILEHCCRPIDQIDSKAALQSQVSQLGQNLSKVGFYQFKTIIEYVAEQDRA